MYNCKLVYNSLENMYKETVNLLFLVFTKKAIDNDIQDVFRTRKYKSR